MKPLQQFAFALCTAIPLHAHAFTLTWPAACTDGVDCFTQNYVDHDATDGAHDFTCGNLTYPNHDGTDIRLKNLAAMRAGVAVLAPADGKVLRVRDGVADKSIRGPNDTDEDAKRHIAELNNQDCGNGVIIQHAEGYQTQLCHMRQGSIRVRPNQAVKAGEPIGLIGLSGNTEFPHVHLTVRQNGQAVDPYNATPMTSVCGTAGNSLWATQHPYHPTMLLGDGFVSAAPDKTTMRDTPANRTTLEANAPALIYWVDLMGLQAGDVLTIRITRPDGSIYAEQSSKVTGSKAQFFSFIGKRNHAPLLAGNYKALLKLQRAGSANPVIESVREISVQ